MFSLSKKTEYGLMALAYLTQLESDQLANVSQIAGSSAIPKELLAKILSELVKAGMAVSFSGPTGGFRLARPASEMSLAEIVAVLEKSPALISCGSDEENCDRTANCAIRFPMVEVQKKVNKILEETMLSDFGKAGPVHEV